jgi:hypothetical protein
VTFTATSGSGASAVCKQAYSDDTTSGNRVPWTRCDILSPPRRTRYRAITLASKLPPRYPSPARRTDADSRTAKVQPQPPSDAHPTAEVIGSSAARGDVDRSLNWPRALTGSKRFPFNNFTYYFTLFSKFFSSFPHGTCSLSVSRPYLALDEIYHPFWAVVPNNPTLRKRLTRQRIYRPSTGFSPSMMSYSKELGPTTPPKTPL